MGDYLRYAMYDKYFKKIGNCVGPSTCPAGTGKDASHYLLSWYYAWGGATDTSGGWAWRIGSSHVHGGYQNPLAAYALSSYADLKPKSATRAGGLGHLACTGSWSSTAGCSPTRAPSRAARPTAGRGATRSPPAGTPTFYGMYYDEQPVYHDPPSNQWFGFQAWSMERVAEYYQQTGNAQAKAVLDKWVDWALSKTTINPDGTYQIPSTLQWSGQPDTWNASSPGANSGLHVTVADYTNDVGVAAAYAKTLTYYAAKSGDTEAKSTAKALLDGMWDNYQDDTRHRRAGDPRRLQPLQRHGVRAAAAGPARCRTATRSTRRRRSPRSAVLLQERPCLVEDRGVPGGRGRARRSRITGSGPRRTSRMAMGSYAELLE